MFENLISIFKKNKKNKTLNTSSKNTAKERFKNKPEQVELEDPTCCK